MRALAYESRDYLAARAGFTVNPVAAPSRREIQDPYLREYFASRERTNGSRECFASRDRE